MAVPIFINPFFMNYILPFVLVFTLIFAILQKTQLLGEGKKQNDSLVALVIALILIAFPFARDIVVKLMPFLAVSIAILLVFMLGYGFIYQGKVEMHKWLKITLVTIFGLALITAVLFITGDWDNVYNFVFGGESGGFWINIILIAVMAGAIIAVLKGKGSETSSSDSDG
jgi:hypothetical protein